MLGDERSGCWRTMNFAVGIFLARGSPGMSSKMNAKPKVMSRL